MSKMRLFELATKLGHTPDEIREELARRGKPAKSNLSVIEAAQVEELSAHFSGKKPAAPAAKAVPKATVAPASTEAAAAGAKAAPKPVVRVSSGGVVRVAPPKVVKPKLPESAAAMPMSPSATPAHASVDMSIPTREHQPSASADKSATEVPDKPAHKTPSQPVVVERPLERPGMPIRPQRQLTSVSFEIPKVARPKPVDRRPAPGTPAVPGAPAAPPPPPTPPPQFGPRKHKKKRKSKEEELEEMLFAKAKAAAAAAAPIVLPPDAPKVLTLPENVTVSELAQAMHIKATDIIRKLMMDYKVMATVNQRLNKDVVETLAVDFGFEIKHEGLFGEDVLSQEDNDDPARVITRAPVVTIMGHVDHGKTTLLDAIRDTDVAGGEHGGITQHIGAYKVHLGAHDGFKGGDVVFLDTPGHAAFTAMRARGAKATDIVVLVVAADDSVMPQTIEAIDHAKEAKVPIVVAINKIDKPGANPDKVMQELAAHGLTPEAWGGSTIMCKLSAKKREGIKELLEMLVLQSDILELKADPGRLAKGVVIEAKLDKGRGAVSTVLVQKGTMRVGDVVVMGNHFGRVRALHNDRGEKLESAGPSTPVEVLGMGGVPVAGETFQAVADEKLARQISAKRLQVQQDRERAERGHVKLEDLFDRIESGDVKELKIVIKADVSGSAEALKQSLEEIKSDKVRARVIHAGVGNINENDVLLAAASDAIVLGFHVKATDKVSELAHREKVEVRLYQVIYEAVTEVKEAMTGLLEPHFKESSIGKGEVRQIFKITKGFIAGSYVTSGKITRGCSIRLFRAGEMAWEGKIDSLKRFKDDVKEVVEGMECGLALDPTSKAQVGDTFEVFVMEEVAQKI